jgi:crotonobetainyl-CoA:carnitine CoA-transferase CaiB-like acyl-CoA transferase
MIDHGMLDAISHWTVGEIDLGEMTGMERFGNRYPMAILDAHKTKDDEYLVFTAQSDDQWESLLKVIGKEEIIAEKWDAHKRNVIRRDDVERWNSEWAATQNLDEALKKLHAAHIPGTGVTTRKQLKTHPQILAREMLVDIMDPVYGKLSGVRGTAPKLRGTPGVINTDITPCELGEHTEEVLTQMLGFSKEKIAELKKQGIV